MSVTIKGRKVISPRQLPSKPPIVSTAAAYLLLDTQHAPGWVWGATTMIFAFLWLAWIVDVITREDIEIKP